MYYFEAINNGNNTITVKSNTYWSCQVDGNFMLSAYDGSANEEGETIEIIIPYEIPVIEGTITFTYGDDRCEYPEIYIYQVNDCMLYVNPSPINNEIYFNYDKNGETMTLQVTTAYNSSNAWQVNVEDGDAKVFTANDKLFIIAGENNSAIKISASYCDNEVMVYLCKGEEEKPQEKEYMIKPNKENITCSGDTVTFRVVET